MDSRSVTRVALLVLPLVAIALAFGGIGYSLATPATTPIPPLEPGESRPPAAVGEITAIEGGEVTIATDQGESLTFTLPGSATIEVLEPISLADIAMGDWLNGGAIAHPQTVLALVNLILVSEPVTP